MSNSNKKSKGHIMIPIFVMIDFSRLIITILYDSFLLSDSFNFFIIWYIAVMKIHLIKLIINFNVGRKMTNCLT